MTSSDSNMYLFLLGHIGNGKSSTGNTILGKSKFRVCNEVMDDGTIETESESIQLEEGLTIQVVDSPGIKGSDQKDEIEQHIREGFKHCPDGFNALVLVLSYGKRFTEEEEKTVEILKEILGENFIQDHCIVVFTHGENFMLNSNGSTFENWWKKQTGALRNLIDECQGRVVLFYNLMPDKRAESVQRLVSLTRSTGDRYSSITFGQVARKRREYIKRKEIPEAKVLIDQIIKYLEEKETVDLLNEAIQQLETKIIASNHEMAKDIRRGIDEVKRVEYDTALQTFKEIKKNFCNSKCDWSNLCGTV